MDDKMPREQTYNTKKSNSSNNVNYLSWFFAIH